jgi:hypothetical protein
MPRSKGEVIDELLANPRRLILAHVCLALISTFILWIRPGTFTPIIRPAFAYGFIVRIPLFTASAWVPYVISAKFARWVLSSRDPHATFLFIGCAILITAVGCCLFLDLFSPRVILRPVVTAAGVTLALVFAAGLSALIWRNDAPL